MTAKEVETEVHLVDSSKASGPDVILSFIMKARQQKLYYPQHALSTAVSFVVYFLHV